MTRDPGNPLGLNGFEFVACASPGPTAAMAWTLEYGPKRTDEADTVIVGIGGPIVPGMGKWHSAGRTDGALRWPQRLPTAPSTVPGRN